MHVNWSALGQVLVVALVVGVGVVSLFSLGVLVGDRQTTEGGTRSSGASIASILCFAACAAIVGYGVYLVVSK
ncbi:hypothetical protein [Actinosynnema sp. NPDC020468]|uniref:hypothetical protein n=1 Tax=Actinosynnema sp. NPDC020468 TaxID=3154488 RepID=UPI0033F46A60